MRSPSGSERQITPDLSDSKSGIPSIVWTVLIVVLILAALAGGIFFLLSYRQKKEREAQIQRKERRRQRLEDNGYSVEEFDLLLEQKRNSSLPRTSNGKTRKKKGLF